MLSNKPTETADHTQPGTEYSQVGIYIKEVLI